MLQSYGVTLHDQKKFPEAEKIYRRAIEIRTKSAKPGDEPVIATVINNLAVLFDDQHNPAEAREVLPANRCASAKKLLPPGDPDKIATIDNLIRLYKDAKNNDEAEALLREALEDVKKAKGENSKEAAYRLDALSFFLVDEGKVDEALKNFDLTLAIRKKILEPKDPDIATSTSNIAFAYFKKHDYRAGHRQRNGAIRIYEDDLAPTRRARRSLHISRHALLSLGKI